MLDDVAHGVSSEIIVDVLFIELLSILYSIAVLLLRTVVLADVVRGVL